MECWPTSTSSHDKGQPWLPPGFRFHPTDEELVAYYLTKKIQNVSFTDRAITEADLNKCEPWDLPGKAKMGEKEWYFYSLRDRKYPTGMRTNRATDAGYWKATGKDREVMSSRTSCLVGMKKTLVFYKGRAPKGVKTNWVMHEYRVEGNGGAAQHLPRAAKDEWVVCRVFQKSAGGKKVPLSEIRRAYMDEASSLPPLLESPHPSSAHEDALPDHEQLATMSFVSPAAYTYGFRGSKRADQSLRDQSLRYGDQLADIAGLMKCSPTYLQTIYNTSSLPPQPASSVSNTAYQLDHTINHHQHQLDASHSLQQALPYTHAYSNLPSNAVLKALADQYTINNNNNGEAIGKNVCKTEPFNFTAADTSKFQNARVSEGRFASTDQLHNNNNNNNNSVYNNLLTPQPPPPQQQQQQQHISLDVIATLSQEAAISEHSCDETNSTNVCNRLPRFPSDLDSLWAY